MSSRSHGEAAPIVPELGSTSLLFGDRGCPFLHRVLALLRHLGVAVDHRESAVGHKPKGLELYSATGRIPLLVHEGLVLTESRVILEYLAERYGLQEAYPKDLATRTRHRHAMARVDNYLAPLLFTEENTADKKDPRLAEVLGILEDAISTIAPHPCLLALHVAPIWRAFRTWHPQGPIAAAIQDRGVLHRWLEAATELDCVASTSVDPELLSQDIARARENGLFGADSP